MVYTIYVERRQGHDNEAKSMLYDIQKNLLINSLESVRFVNRYFAEDISENIFEKAVPTIFSEPQTDIASREMEYSGHILIVEYLPGQFDQRSDSCEQCIQILAEGVRPKIKTAKIYIFGGDITEDEFEKIKNYIINPVECRETTLLIPQTLNEEYEIPDKVDIIDDFISATDSVCCDLIKKYGLAMDIDDIKFCREYFKNTEKRNPTITELKLLDTYWSDHCRHTTFLTILDDVKIDDPIIKATYDDYMEKRKIIYTTKNKSITLMDAATIAAKYLKKTGALKNLDESEEINACSVKIKVNTPQGEENWLLMFKNETHNHPTEIEPYGGAATCIGGAIRDPLSGRAYVYQAMRVTGAADPRIPVAQTMKGKLPQSKLTVTAANGYSSYGNQIGLATGGVYEIYHPDYVTKRLEIGAVIGAVPEKNVVREQPIAGDIVILLGGRTGRDGCGGASGSSKAHNSQSLASCGAEVQKGNAPVERKIQRLFRNPEVTHLIKRCNDFGAGGISVAVGELADGLCIDLSKVPKKYEGLDGTELAISESQERMAVVVCASNTEKFIKYAEKENLEATAIAFVTDDNRLKMEWNGNTIVDISRDFINTNGADKHSDVYIPLYDNREIYVNSAVKTDIDTNENNLKNIFTAIAGDLNICSQKGLSERFDSSIGAATVILPHGGKYQLTPSQYMAAKIPLQNLCGTTTVSVMAYGFNPYISKSSPYIGSYLAVLESITKLVAAGVDYKNIYLTFQEYFEKLRNDPARWGKPLAALLGAYRAQLDFASAAIGGKDSMSGSYENLDVPPTLVSFAVGTSEIDKIISNEFKNSNSYVYLLEPKINSDMLPDKNEIINIYNQIGNLNDEKKIKAAYTLTNGGTAEAILKMCAGNNIGFVFENFYPEELTSLKYGSVIIESAEFIDNIRLIGHTITEPEIRLGNSSVKLNEILEIWKSTLSDVFPVKPQNVEEKTTGVISYTARSNIKPSIKTNRPKIIIPVFPGTNCEYDTARAFEKAGAEADIFVLCNLNSKMLAESIDALAAKIKQAQILVLPGGFSGGDEPDGSGKFITAILRSPKICDAVTNLLDIREGLALGICNGFQALIKSGLLPYGKILPVMDKESPTLTFNSIGRHQALIVNTRVSSVKSPWMALCEPGEIHTIPISHGEGRFIANNETLKDLIDKGNVATQYCTPEGIPTMESKYNPNSSLCAIEGIFSPDGRIFGKMGHTERIDDTLAINIKGNKNQRIFEAGVLYFK